MKKRNWIGMLCMLAFSLTACGGAKESVSVSETAQAESSTVLESEEKLEESAEEGLTSEESEEKALQPDAAGELEERGIPVLMGEHVPFAMHPITYTDENPDGGYYYECESEDGYATWIHCASVSMREDLEEDLESYLADMAVGLAFDTANDLTVQENATYSDRLGIPVYLVQFKTGGNEDTRVWKVFAAEANGYVYLSAFHVWADAFEEMDAAIDAVFSDLSLSQEKTTADWWKQTMGVGKEAKEYTLEELRNLAAENGDLCAAVSLGYDSDIAAFLKEADGSNYPFLFEIPEEQYVGESDGVAEIFCIIPTNPNASLTVNEWKLDEADSSYGEAGQTFYRRESGEPILLLGNPSNVFPSIQVVIEDPSGAVLDWNPSVWMQEELPVFYLDL